MQRPSVMAAEEAAKNKRLTGAVNADFFSVAGRSTNHGVVDGEIVKLETYSSDPRVYWPALSIDTDQKLSISCHAYAGELRYPGRDPEY
ncbi:MAG: hypothetical protein U5N56_00540 [Candidatus Marinimicrobia bacterium]|nr:hypothetical protein [Candidatus Neomarinimicrobiota bacterium]